MRAAAPELVLGVRLSADAPAAVGVAGALGGRVDYLSLALGESSTYRGSVGIAPPPPFPENAVAELTGPFRGGPPVIATTRVVDPAAADRLIREGRADAVGMTRALITDPHLPRKSREGRLRDVLRCIGCNACIAHYHAGTPIACAQNPRTGRELSLPPAKRVGAAGRIVVVGAGSAGLAAAAELHASGVDVLVLERSDRIGGQLALAGAAPGHADTARALCENYERLLDAVEVRLGVAADAAAVAALRPEAVVVATGARPYEPPTGCGTAVQAWNVLAGEIPGGMEVVVADWGGDASGLAAAEVLAAAGRHVILAVASVAVGASLHQYTRNLYLERLYRAGVRIEHHLELVRAEPRAAVLRNVFAPELEARLPADAVVLALGRVPNDGLGRALAERGLRVEQVGDCRSPRSLEEAILEGTLAARSLALALAA